MTVLDGLWKVKELSAPEPGLALVVPDGHLRLVRDAHQRAPAAGLQHADRRAGQRRRGGRRRCPTSTSSRTWSPTCARCSRPTASCCRTCSATTRRSRTTRPGSTGRRPHELEQYLQFSYCIKCGCCMAACPTVATDPQYAGPMPLGQAHRYNSDTRDGGFAAAPRGALGRERAVALPLRRRVLAGLPQGRGPGQGDPAHEAGPGVRPAAAAPAPAAGRRWPRRPTARRARASRRRRRGR